MSDGGAAQPPRRHLLYRTLGRFFQCAPLHRNTRDYGFVKYSRMWNPWDSASSVCRSRKPLTISVAEQHAYMSLENLHQTPQRPDSVATSQQHLGLCFEVTSVYGRFTVMCNR